VWYITCSYLYNFRYNDDSDSDDESDAEDISKEELLEQFFLAESANMDGKIPVDDTPKLKIRADTLNPVEDNPSTPTNSVEGNHGILTSSEASTLTNSVEDNPVCSINPDNSRLLQETGIIVSAEEVSILPSIRNSKPSYAPVNRAFSELKVSTRDQDPLLDPKNTARAKEVAEDRVEQDKEFIQCMDDMLPTGKPNLVIPNF